MDGQDEYLAEAKADLTDGLALRADGAGSDAISEAIRRKALGYCATESVDEYGVVDGELILLKRKVTQKEVPPDTAAIKLLLESGEKKPTPTLEELECERERLMKLFFDTCNRPKGAIGMDLPQTKRDQTKSASVQKKGTRKGERIKNGIDTDKL